MSIGGNRTRYIADMHAQETNRLSTSVSVYKCDNITPSQVQPQVARTSKIRMQEKPVLGLYKKTDCRKLSESRSSLECDQRRSVGYRRPGRTAILPPPKVVRCPCPLTMLMLAPLNYLLVKAKVSV